MQTKHEQSSARQWGGATSLPIVLDSREVRSSLPALMERLWSPVSVHPLQVGDVAIGRVLVERKEAHDFILSLHSGRLFRQAYKLKGATRRPLVILEGDPYSLVAPDRVGSMRGAVLSLLTGYGIPILRTPDVEGTAEALRRIAVQEVRREERRSKSRDTAEEVTPDRATREREEQTLAILEALPGVGSTRARALLRHFGSLERIVQADPAELARAPGIGAMTAARILCALVRGSRTLAHPVQTSAESTDP